ncbi:surface protein [Kordia periserrulae]|uniref:Surface protein n=1 Tax=Kordia periserrulae TaxID=701523 RepID=A0A2T6C227_9FLAO|nr:invasin domain 3-containing protein [Kordia periserrulae]PTX62353.1 surface protein [Kordia periserrulae]
MSFITKWQTNTNNESITIPATGGGYNYSVDWGDGSIETGFTGNATHFYSTAGIYTITITGDFPHFVLDNAIGQLVSVEQWGTIKWKSMANSFANGHFQLNAQDTPDLSDVTDMSYMFYKARIEIYTNIENWDVSNVTNMLRLFFQEAPSLGYRKADSVTIVKATDLNDPYNPYLFNQDISNWDVSNVTDMYEMFYHAGYYGYNGFSTANYDALLIAWSKLTLQRNVVLGVTANFCLGEVARTKIINNFGWTITDEGKDIECEEATINLYTSTIKANPTSIIANGTNTSLITVQLKNTTNTNITTGGETVVISTNLGTLTTTTENGDGTYTASLSATSGGVALVSFTVNGQQASTSASINLTAVSAACEAHIAFVIDESGSIDQTEAAQIRSGLQNFIDTQLNGPFYISLIGMSPSDVNNREDHIKYQQVTPTTKATFDSWITAYRNRGIGAQADYWASGLEVVQSLEITPDIVVIITDGLQVNNVQILLDRILNVNNQSHIFTYGILSGGYRNSNGEYVNLLKDCLESFLERLPILSVNSNDLLTTDYIGYSGEQKFTDLGNALSGLSQTLITSEVGCGNIEIIENNISVNVLNLYNFVVNVYVGFIKVRNYKSSTHTIMAGTQIASINGILFTTAYQVIVPPNGTEANVSIHINGFPVREGSFTQEIAIAGILNPQSFQVAFSVEIEEVLVISENYHLQSKNLYLQSAGSTGNDGSVKGIHLRWLLKGYLGDAHLPKGNNATQNHHFNKPDDFVRIYRAPYVPQYLTLNFENSSPNIVDHNRYLWTYRINEVTFYTYFKNTIKYNSVKATINPLVNSYGFIQAYGNELIEVEHKTALSFAVHLRANTDSIPIKAETLSVEQNSLTATKYVTARKEFTGQGRFEEENIRAVRYKANHITQIQFELYADAFAYNHERNYWKLIGDFALTLNDTEAENRLESANGSTRIHGVWPRFNDGETVNKENYIDRWNGQETQAYETDPAYHEYYDRRLKTIVKRYIELSDEEINNPMAIESIPFSAPLPEDVVSQEEDVQDISNLTMIQLASMDYHVARILGLGHIDNDINTSQIDKKYIYLAEYTTVANIKNGQQGENAEEIQHLYLSLPTAMENERLPMPVDLLEPIFGTNNLDNENINKSIDAEGYLLNGKQRFISLVTKELPENDTNINFFENTDQFSTSETTIPVYVGLEYKLFDPLNPDASSWRKPELSNTSNYKNFTLSTDETSIHNETIPILIPEPNETLFLHREREEGWHRYSSYGINWFSRSQRSTVFWDVETRFKTKNRLLPPSNIKACLIVEESPLMFSSSHEQDLLRSISNDDKTLVRLTFDHHINQDRITYQINEESMGTYEDPLDKNAIFKDSKEVFADKINIFFRNRSPQTVAGKIKSIAAHPNNTLATIRTEAYQLASTGEEIVPNIPVNQLSHFVGSVFMFNNVKYIIHEIAASTVTGEGPIFTVYKELISQAMLTGTEPDPTIPLELPKPNGMTMFNTVENMLTESNWQIGTSVAVNKLGFQIEVGYDSVDDIHREILEEESISGVPEKILEKSRGIWETAIIEEALRPKENIYQTDDDGNDVLDNDGNKIIIAEPTHVGMYKISFPGYKLNHHPQFDSHHVDWYQGIVRIHTQNNPTKKRKILEVVSIENIGSTEDDLIIYAIDPQYPVNVEDVNQVDGFDPILTGEQEVNFYPNYKMYLYYDAAHYLTEDAILPDTGEEIRYSILGLQTVDPNHPEEATNSADWYKSKISQPALFFAQEVISPETPLLSNGEDFIYATRPDTFGKSTFSLTPSFKHIPHGLQFYRSNDDAILNALYSPATVLEIKEKLKEDFDPKFHLVKRWQNLVGFNFEYEETYQTDNTFFLYPEDETGYRFPNPDKYQLYKSINDILEYRNHNYEGVNQPLLNLGNPNDDNDNGIIGTLSLTEIVIPALPSEGIDEPVSFKEYIKSVLFNVFTPLTEIPLMYQYIKPSSYTPIAKKQVIRDDNGDLLSPSDPKFDMAPMAKIMSAQFISEIEEAKTRILFTDFNLDGTSNNLYFYAIREIGNTMQLGEYSPVLGPVKLVNTKPPQNPDIKRVMPILENNNLNIEPGISIEINAYPKIQNIKQVKLYRTLNPKKALSVRTMELVKTIDLEADEQLLNNIWKLKDEFTDLTYVPYGDPLYYRVTALRKIQYVDGSNIVKDNHPQVTEYVPSEPSKLLISSIVENANPDAPSLEYNFDTDSDDNSLLHNIILKWDKKVHNGKYYLYKMNSQGNWFRIHVLISNADSIQLLLTDTSLQSGTLSTKNAEGDSKYHHFKVMSENSAGMMSTEEKILTIPRTDTVAQNEGIGDMIIESTNIIR